MQTISIADLKSLLPLLKSKGWNDSIRLLDQFELSGGTPGSACSMQVLSYDTGEWLLCELNGKDIYSLAHWNKIIRIDLGWDGAIRLAVAA